MVVSIRNLLHVGDFPACHKKAPVPHQVITKDATACVEISRLLAMIGDKWSMLIVHTLGNGPRRLNALRREIGDISQKMLATTLRDLKECGFVSRTVTPTKPPQVEYALTDLGCDFLKPVKAFAEWTWTHSAEIEAARARYRGSLAAE